jgi:hypothetical protein
MARSHALQPRIGSARPVAVRFTDDQLEGIADVGTKTSQSSSEVIRSAVEHHVLIRSQPMVSAFWTTYGATLEQLFVAGVRPVVVGLWAAIAHGYVATAPRIQLVVADEERPALAAFLAARGARDRDLPAAYGIEPWVIEFLPSWASKGAHGIKTQTLRCGRIEVGVATLDELLRNIVLLPAWSHEDLWALSDGGYRNDDSSRGEAAWDYAGRMNASAASASQRGGAHFFIDFRRSPTSRP